MRVLNLWQKNEVFPTDVIQKLMALAPNPGKAQVLLYSSNLGLGSEYWSWQRKLTS